MSRLLRCGGAEGRLRPHPDFDTPISVSSARRLVVRHRPFVAKPLDERCVQTVGIESVRDPVGALRDRWLFTSLVP